MLPWPTIILSVRSLSLEAEGKVLSINQKCAVVEVLRKSACSGKCDGCSTCTAQPIRVEALIKTPVSVGDTVVVSSEKTAVLIGIFILFMVPLLLPIGFYLIFANSALAIPGVLFAVLCSILLIVALARNKNFLEKTKPAIICNYSRKR